MNIFNLFKSKKPAARKRWKDEVDEKLDFHEEEIASLWGAVGSIQAAQAAAPAAPAAPEGQTPNTESLEALEPLAELEPVDSEVSYDG